MQSVPRARALIRSATALTFALAALLARPAPAQSFVAEHGRLQVSGNRIVDMHGRPLTLRGMALYWSQWKPAFYNSNCVRWLRDDWKCTVVRASIAVRNGGYLTNPDAELAKVRTVIRAAIDLGVYVIVDYHETGNGNDNLAQAKRFFGDISKEFGNSPNIIYETWNEPLNTHAWATVVKPYHEAVIPVIRANDSANIILCGTRSWSQDVDEAAKDPIRISRNLAYTLHFYAATHKAFLRTKAQAALAAGIALIATEGGLSEASGNGAIDTVEAVRWTDFMDQNGIAWMNWSVADLTESSAALRPGASGAGGWAPTQLSPSGTWVRNRLRAKNASVAIALPRLRVERGQLTYEAASHDAAGRSLPEKAVRGNGIAFPNLPWMDAGN